jgi:GGDEF domain-containing protein
VISLKKFLAVDPETERALLRVIRMLIEGIGQHAIAGDLEESTQFRENIKTISDGLAEEISPAELLARATAVLNRFEDHTRRTVRHHRLQTAELQNMVKMLTSTIGAVSAASQANVSILGEIEKQVATASELADVRVIKAKLSDCLVNIRKESERQQRDTGETIEQLSAGLEQARKGLANIGETRNDPVTGLPPRPEAESALAHWGRSGTQSFAAVMVLDRLQTLNARFGQEAGDEILACFSRMIQERLQTTDRLFRWSGPALLALLPRQGGLDYVRGEFGRVMETRLEHTIQTPTRSIMVPVMARWTVFPMIAAPRLFYQKIDNFIGRPVS